MPALNDPFQEENDALRTAKNWRELREVRMLNATQLQVDGRHYTAFCSNDYLGLAHDNRVIAAATQALVDYGAGASSSRLISGNHPLYAPLEAALAAKYHAEAALVFSSGYAANIGVIPAIVSRGDLVLIDRLAHACLIDGVVLSGAKILRFRHNDMVHLEALLQEHRARYRRCLIVSEHVFSMDGDMVPLETITQLAKTHDALTMIDDAHGLVIHKKNIISNVDIWMGTLSKALASQGGYITGKKVFIERLVNSARSFMFSTGLPPATLAAAHAALNIWQAEPWRTERALNHAKNFCKAMELPSPQSQIVPVITGGNARALALSEALKAGRLWVQAIRPPTVPKNTARLRISFSAAHGDEQVQALVNALKACHASA